MKYNWTQMECQWLQWVVLEAAHNLTQAAKIAGLSRAGIYHKLKRHGLLDWHEEFQFEARKQQRAKLSGDDL